jgi:methylglutamate dehydrogenase subunit D
VASMTLDRRSALLDVAVPGRFGARRSGAPPVTLVERAGLAIALVTARKGKAVEAIEALAAFAQVRPLDRPSVVAKDGVALIGVAPGQWLAVAEPKSAVGFAAAIAEACAVVATVTDHTSAKAVVRIAGARARDALAKGCPIDLDARAFKPGDAATTRIALIDCSLWQVSATAAYDLAVDRSIAPSFWGWLTSSAAEYGYEVLPSTIALADHVI